MLFSWKAENLSQTLLQSIVIATDEMVGAKDTKPKQPKGQERSSLPTTIKEAKKRDKAATALMWTRSLISLFS